MAKILVVDDSPIDRVKARGLLERRRGMEAIERATGLTVLEAENAEEALRICEQHKPDLILTDLVMPGMNGLELVEAVRARYPVLPIVLMTAVGSADIAVQSLRRGAASFVPKQQMASELLDTVEEVLRLTTAERGQQRLHDCLRRTQAEFCLDNDPALIPPFVALVRENLRRVGCCDENERLRVGVALSEALLNAMYHGNLEVGSELRETDDTAYRRLLETRRGSSPYRDRRVYVLASESNTEARYVVRDEGPGFDVRCLPTPTAPPNLEKVSGRGLLLMRMFMDEMHHNSSGNEITLVKRGRG